jgi:Flp pilus assembly pilin Flp
MPSRNDADEVEHPRSPTLARGLTRLVRRCASDESGSASLEYLLVTLTCGLLVAVGLIGAIGPSLVSMWSARRACLYDAVCIPASMR